jgi:hypothetical protein
MAQAARLRVGRYGAAAFALRYAAGEGWRIRQDLNLQPSDPKSEALSN